MADASIKGIDFTITADASSATAQLDALSNALGKIRKSVSSGLGLGGASKDIKALSKAFKALDTAKLSSFASSIKKITNKDASSNLYNVSYALERISHIDLTSVSVAMQGLANAVDRLKKSGTQQAAKDVGSVGDEAKKSAPHIGGFAEKLGTVVSAFKRIAFYRLIRTVIKSITQAFKEGLQNVYQYSRAIGGDFAGAMDKLASASLKMKNQLGAALAGLLVQLAPIIEKLIALVTRLADAITQIFAVLSGKSTYTRAVDVAVQWGDALDNAAGAAKELKKSILGIDELNLLTDNKNSGGGSGGSSSIPASQMFEEAELSEWAQWLQEHLETIKDLAIAIGAAILGWKLTSVFSAGIGNVAGSVLTIAGAAELALGSFDAWTNGVDWDNLTQMWIGEGGLVAGLGLLFGVNGAGTGLVVSGIAEIVTGMKDWLELGELTNATFWDLESGIWSIAGGLTLITGSPIPLAIGAILSVGLDIVYDIQGYDSPEEYFEAHNATLKQSLEETWDSFVELPIVVKIKEKFESDWKALKEDLAQDPIVIWLSAQLDTMKSDIEYMADDIQRYWDEHVISIPFVADFIERAKNDYNSLETWFNENVMTLPIVTDIQTMASDIKNKIVSWWKGEDVTLEADVSVKDGSKQWGKDAESYWTKGVVDGSLGGVIGYFSVHPINETKAWIEDLKKYWKKDGDGKSVGYAKIGIYNTIQSWWQKLKEWWTGKTEDKELGKATIGAVNSTKTWKEKLSGWWSDLTSGKDVGKASVGVTNTTSTWREKLKTWWSNLTSGKNIGTTSVGVTNTSSSWWTSITTWWKNFTSGKTAGSFDVSVDNDSTTWWSDVKTWWKNKAGELTTTLNIKKPTVTVTWEKDSILGLIKVPKFDIKWYAEGGFPGVGELFFARENGPEFVGRMGNSNAVANNEQIVEGIAAGVAEANARQNELLREQNELLRRLLEKEWSTEITTASIASASNRKNLRDGKTVLPVGV